MDDVSYNMTRFDDRKVDETEYRLVPYLSYSLNKGFGSKKPMQLKLKRIKQIIK